MGCPACKNTGHNGREAVYEIIIMTPEEAVYIGGCGPGCEPSPAGPQKRILVVDDDPGILILAAKVIAKEILLARIKNILGRKA